MNSLNKGSSILRSSKGKIDQKAVYKLTKPIFMKFRPIIMEEKVEQTGFLSKIKSLGKMFSPRNKQSAITPTEELNSTKIKEYPPLKYLFKIDYDNYLIGNQLQLDSIVIYMQDDDVETQVLWSFRLQTPIQSMLVHDRKRNIILFTKGELRIYQFQGRKSKNAPVIIATFPIKDQIKLIQFAQESTVAVITEKFVSIYTIDGVKSRQKAEVEYKNDLGLEIFQISESVDHINYDDNDEQKSKFFELWCMPIQFKQKLVLQQMKMIYLIQKKFKKSLKIFSLSKDCYIMNLGKLIYLFKKNYYIDKIVINMQSDYSYLQLFNQKTIGLVCQTQIDFYQLITDLVSNPPKIRVRSFDSIRRDNFDSKFMYLDGIKFQQHKYIFFFQVPTANYNGQINYQFYITQKWQFEQKINSILPTIALFAGKLQQKDAAKMLNEVDICWDVLNKMGLSRRDAYLRIWKQSKRQSIQQFNLLLDTHDYMTIRQQIQLKLKKKSMLLIQVIKIQLGCLNMIHQNVFSSKYTADQFKNYLISHYFMRVLESFKQIRIYQKQAGKLKITHNQEKQSKFYINIQQYTNLKQSDMKNQIIQLINGLCKHRKDNSTEIRVLIRKFKFSIKIIYEEFLKQIVHVAQKDLLYLLQTIPQLLPYSYPASKELDQPTLYQGVWGNFTDIQWEKGLYLDNVVTIYNREKVIQEKNSLWVKRNWLKYHDMIFLTKQQIIEQHKKLTDGRLFYSMVSLTFQIQKDQDKINNIINYLQDNYVDFPHHLFNNVKLYRQLFLYFKSNSKSSDTFEAFMVKKDEQIMKQIFDHEKAKKGSFLKQVKPIYQKINKCSKFNHGLLKYFSSNLSQPSDIKYLLNRINNQKREFHAQNQEMYEVLIKGMQIKLKLGSEKDIPIHQVLIYIQNLPLKEQNPVTKELQILKKINQKGQKLKRTKLNMSVFEIIRMREIVLYNIIGFQIEESGIRNDRDTQIIVQKSQKILKEIKQIRQKIYGNYEDNINLFIFLIKILQTVEMATYVFDIIQKNKDPSINFDNGQIENAVYYLYKRTLINNPIYEQANAYIQQLITILPQDNHLRIFIQSQFEFASIVNQNPYKFEYPICGQSGVITILQLSAIINSLDKNTLANLNIKRIVQLSVIMQQILLGQPQIQQFQIYQIYCVSLVRNGKLKETLKIIQVLLQIQKDSEFLLIYPIVIFRSIFPELIDQNKNLMAHVIRILFDKPTELLELFKILLSNSYSNEDQKKLLFETIQKNPRQSLRFNPENSLFDSDVIAFMKENPEKNEQFNNLFHHHFQQLLSYQEGFNKNPDIFLVYLLILKNEKLVIKYISFLRYQINIRMLRGFLSYLSQFQSFDCLKLLQFSKQLFKILYNLQKNTFNVQSLISEILISQKQEISLQSINNSRNCEILASSVQKFKAKIKLRQGLDAKSLKKMGQNENKRQIKLNKIKELLLNTQKDNTFEYTYNDSDDYVTKVQQLTIKKIEKLQKKEFCVNKFLMWMFNRRNQLIQYYLLRANQNQAQETLRQLEEKLKCSFTKITSNEALTKNAGLVIKAFNQNVSIQQNSPPAKSFFNFLVPVSQIPVVVESQIHAQDIFSQNPKSQIMMVNGLTILKDDLIKSLMINEDQAIYDYKLLETSIQLQQMLPLLFKDIYNQPSIDLQKSLFLIREIYHKHSKAIFVNEQFIKIYLKIQQLINKLRLSLQSRSLLPLQGLYIKQKDSSHLFNFIKPSLFQQLNQSNVHILSRIISLSFIKAQFQQEINSQFLKNIITEYEQLDGSNVLDQNLKIEKISAFLLSMQISHLKMQTPKTIALMTNKQKKNKIVSLISDTLRKKNDLKSADLFEAKFMEVIQ